MNNKKYFVTIKSKIMFSTLIPVVLSFIFILSLNIASLLNSFQETAEAKLFQISQKYASDFELKIINAMNYLSLTTSDLGLQLETPFVDRELMQKTAFVIFDDFGIVDGSSIYFEPNAYDGKDFDYVGTQYGTERSGRIAYYFYRDGEETIFLTEALENDEEFHLPHYLDAKKSNKTIYTKPFVYEIDNKRIPMFTITKPIQNSENLFVGAVTADIFLDDIYTKIQDESIYETGYLVIANDNNQVIYTPHFEDIGKTREEVGINHTLPNGDETSIFFESKSILNGNDTLVAINAIYIPQLDSHFYISVAAPLKEINADGYHLMSILIGLGFIVVVGIALFLYYLMGKFSSPIKEITQSVNEIAKGGYSARITGNYKDEFAIVKASVNAMADSIEASIKETSSSREILKNILNGLDAFIYVTDLKTDEILFMNQCMKEHFDIKENPIGAFCYKVLQNDIDERCDFCPCFQLDKEPNSVIVWEEFNNRTNRYYRNTDCYIEWLGGNKVHLRHAVDITDLKTYMNDKLVAEREALEFKHEKEKAEAAAQGKNDFLAKMSHEIRTPMNAVMGMTELILRKDLPQDVYENTLMIKSAGANLLSIINDILDFSKIESGKIEIIETNYMLPSLVNDVVSVIKVRLMDRPIHLAVNVDPLLPISLVGDEVRIRQMLTNLLNNAVKYTNDGFVSLTISGEVDKNSVMLVAEVSDSGIGIKEEDIGRLFGDFVQIDTTKNRGIEGTGLGLAITRELSRIMGGDISLQSVYEEGSTFTLTLPQKIKDYKPFASVDNINEKSVLIYETRPIYKESIIKALKSLGVKHKNVENIPSLFAELEKYSFVFVSSFAYGSIGPVLLNLDNPPKLVLLADITEASAPKTARVLALPAHELSIANILNDIFESSNRITPMGVSFTAPAAKVLIVDDIMANLKVIEGLLLPYNLQVKLCSNGVEAVKLASEEQYDLVFMDHMMPGMDGLETTRHIREKEGDYYQNLPIVALTANAVLGVREMFISNGMDDFLAKPIETTKLDAILEKWIPEDKKIKQLITEDLKEKNEFVEMLSSVSQISLKKALAMVGGSEDTYERIVKLSARLLPENIKRLDNLIDTSLSNYAIEVHGIKGVLNNIGAYNLGMAAFELEELSKNGDLDTCRMLHASFIKKLSEFSNTMNELIDKSSMLSKSKGDISIIIEAVPKLTEANEYYDSALALEIISSVAKYTFSPNIDKIINELTSAFENFDFDTATTLMDELTEITS